MKRIVLLASMLLCAAALQAQVVDSAHFLINYVPKLNNASKINQQAEIVDTATEKVEFRYVITPQKPELTFEPTPITASKLSPEVQERFYRNYLKVGFGYPITPLAELSVHNTRNTKYSYGLNFHHFSSWAEPIGKVQKRFAYAPTSDTRLHLFLNRYFKNYTLYSSVGYNHELANLFGYDREWGIDPYFYEKSYRDSIRNNFNHVKAEVGIRSNFTTEDRTCKEDVRLHYDFLRTYWRDIEHDAGLKSMVAYDARFLKISGYQHYQLDLNLDYFNNTWGDSIVMGAEVGNPHKVRRADNSFEVELRPTMNFTIKEYHILAGVGVPVIVANNMAQCPVYPIAEVQLGLVRGLLSIYAGVDGRTEYNSLKNLLYENPYVKPHLDSLKFTKTQISIYGGIKGNIVKKLNYHISARYSYSRDMAFFILDTNSLLKNQFDIVYADRGSMLNVCANLSWETLDHLFLNLNANYWGYYFNDKDRHPEHAWYKPTWDIGFEGRYILNKKFVFDVNAKVGFGRWALVPKTAVDETGKTYIASYEAENDLLKNSDGEHLVKPVLNFGVGFEYIINPQFTAWVAVNNIGCQYATNYYGFNNFGINAMAGITYSFGNEPLKPQRKKR
ncbi:MAG: hypothetical protein K5636_01495 [Bacteroidales bacterium]|nr:hypothetical protein [Bacteroidales bacterium]